MLSLIAAHVSIQKHNQDMHHHVVFLHAELVWQGLFVVIPAEGEGVGGVGGDSALTCGLCATTIQLHILLAD